MYSKPFYNKCTGLLYDLGDPANIFVSLLYMVFRLFCKKHEKN